MNSKYTNLRRKLAAQQKGKCAICDTKTNLTNILTINCDKIAVCWECFCVETEEENGPRDSLFKEFNDIVN